MAREGGGQVVALRHTPLAALVDDVRTVAEEHKPIAHLVLWITADGQVHSAHAGAWPLLHAMLVEAEAAIEAARQAVAEG